MSLPDTSERLTVVLRAAQYLSNLSHQQDPWTELTEALKTFFKCDLVLIVRSGPDEGPRLMKAFSSGINVDEVLAQTGDELRAVLESGFLGSQLLFAPPCSLAFLPLPRNRRTATVVIVGHAGEVAFTKEDLEILLALGGLFGNVVARVETERELLAYQQNLEGLVARRTQELETSNVQLLREIKERERAEEDRRKFEERLVQSQKLESLGVLVAGVAHNFNNLLAIIMGTASIQELVTTDPADLNAYRTIGNACERGRKLVLSLVHFGKPTLSQKAPTDLKTLITEVRILLESGTGNRIRIIEEHAGDPLWVLGDAGSLSTILMNLCLNSLDAMPDGGTLTLRTALLDPERVEIAVEDTGTGMAPEVLARVVEPFFTTKPVGKGTGLGLSIAYGVVQAHGGALKIASQRDQGTQVKIELPRFQGPAQERPVQARPPAPVPSSVLLVDDDSAVRILMARMLRKAGVQEVTAVPGGLEAIASLQSGYRPDLVILDQNMPGMDGVQTMEAVRRLEPELPILISSGQPGIKEWDSFRRPGVAIIPKPFTMAEITEKLSLL